MKRRLGKKTVFLTAAALTMTLGLSVGTAMAYFTTYTEAAGGVELELGFTETIPHEEVTDWTKHIRIENTGNYDCYVRVKVFAGEKFQDSLTYSDDSGKWTKGADEYYYYSDIVPAGGMTEELRVMIDHMDAEQSFNVIVVQECTLVQYDDNGSPYADWNTIADSGEEVYEGEQGEGEQ